MDLSLYFKPIGCEWKNEKSKISSQVSPYITQGDFPAFKTANVVLFSISETEDDKASSLVRDYLYHLANIQDLGEVADCGDLICSDQIKDTLYAVSEVVEYLIGINKKVILINGLKQMTYAVYQAFAKLEQLVNLTVIDQTINLGSTTDELSDVNYLSKIMLGSNNYLFNFSQLAHQSHFVGVEQLALLERLHFDHVRLGELHAQIEITEPIMRNTDVSIFNLSAVRMADAPGSDEAGPNGLFGEEYCRMARYAGISDKVSVGAFFGYNEKRDVRGVSAHLQAQSIWYFLEGVSLRKNDFPIGTKESYIKYLVDADSGNVLEFLKSNKSDRWWITVPVPAGKEGKYFRHHLIPCTYNDYQKACNNELPDIWIKTIQKLS